MYKIVCFFIKIILHQLTTLSSGALMIGVSGTVGYELQPWIQGGGVRGDRPPVDFYF